MVEFTNYKLELQLEAQMPMIHFQSAQCGATLRASEVKPKLDRFILESICRTMGKTIKQLKEDSEYKGFFLDADSDNNDALDYKLQITVMQPPTEIDLGSKEGNYSIYYGNMGKEPSEKIYGIFSEPLVTVICFKPQLRKYIQENIVKFFLTTNFGTMQNKGFGSFAPASWLPEGKLTVDKKAEVAKAYGELIPGCHCYAMEFEYPKRFLNVAERNAFCVKMSEEIKTFYSIMKSGQNRGKGNYARSFIYQYMHDKLHLGNEKAWMKQNNIAPAISKPENEGRWMYPQGDTHYYVRAFLGIGEKIEFGSAYNDRGFITAKKKVEIKSKEFERISSPIYFKVLANVVFIVGFEIPEELYDAEFNFKGEWKRVNMNLSTPSKEALAATGFKFDIQDFLDEYVKYFNGNLRKEDLPRINKSPKVVRINA